MSYSPAVADPAVDAGAEPDQPRQLALHLGLFVATCTTTFLAGAGMGERFEVWRGVAFAGTLMFILTCHEMGHFVVARWHGIPASLPFFIPLPPGISLGTMGAVIRMRQPITSRNHLVDVGAAGPLAGMAVAVPLLVVGLGLSPVGPPAGGVLEGNSLLYLALKLVVHGRVLPAADGTDVLLHPIGFAAWVGLLITFINLIPIGQLDGGHVACGFLGERHERLSSGLHRLLLLIGLAVAAWLAFDARRTGYDGSGVIGYGIMGALPWLVWALLLLILRRASGDRYHPPAVGPPLDGCRRAIVAAVAILFVSIFTPVPMRELLVPLFDS
jgi:membrane-associated protease RseP (regulator of RpoE activity)